MPIKTIMELQAKPGQRDELIRAMDNVLASMKNAKGFMGIARFEVIDNPDSLIEIAEGNPLRRAKPGWNRAW